VRERKNLKEALALLSPENKTFWRQYEIDLGYYHTYSVIQGYFQLFTFWYFKPSLSMEIVLYTLSRMVATMSSQPLAILSQWSHDHDFDYGKLFQHVCKRSGKRGLFAGARDMLFNEFLLSIILIPGIHLVASII